MASGAADLERTPGLPPPARRGIRLGAWRRALSTSAGNRHLLLLELARFASVTGRWAYTVTFAVFAYRAAGAEGVAIAGVVRLAPAALAASAAGTLVGRMSVSGLLLRGGLGRTFALAGAGALIFLGGPSWTVYALVAAESALSAVIRPAQSSLLPTLARTPAELTSTNLALSVIESAGLFIGPLLGAALLHATGAGVVFVAAAAAYLVSTVLLASIPVSARVAAPVRSGGSLFGEIAAGARSVTANRDATVVVLLYGAQSLVGGLLNVLIVVIALRLLGLGTSGVGTLISAIGAGGVIGGALVLLRLRRSRHGADLRGGLLLWGLPLLLVAVLSSPAATIALFALVGVGFTIVDVSTVTLLQRLASGEALSHALGLLQAVFVTGTAAGTLLAPPLVVFVGPRGALAVTGALLPLLAAVLWARLRRLDRRLATDPARVGLLAAIPIFEPLTDAALEHLASVLEPVATEGGDAVVVQGDPGDAFYVVEGGRLDVAIDGESVRALGPGDYFGEIALLRNVPRTATVTARTPARLLRLDGARFLATVTGNASSAGAADAIVGARLGFGSGLTPL